MKSVCVAVAAATVVSACAETRTAGDRLGPLEVRTTNIGRVLTDSRGMTLYTYKDDPAGGSVCYGRCARSWPPMTAAADASPEGELSIIRRRDGVAQWAYRGKALYGWKRDKRPGETTGHEYGGAWYAARP